MELTKLISLLEERLVQHDDNRKEIQSKVDDICAQAQREADTLEEKLGGKIRVSSDSAEGSTLNAIGELNSKLENPDKGMSKDTIIRNARCYMNELKFEIRRIKDAKNFVDSYVFALSSTPIKEGNASGANEMERIVALLQENLEKIHESMISSQDSVLEICSRRRKEAEEMKKRVNESLEEFFSKEDARLQGALKEVREKMGSTNPKEVRGTVARGEAALVVGLKYSLENSAGSGISLGGYNITATEEIYPELLCLETRKPEDFAPSFQKDGEVSLSFALFSEEEKEFLKLLGLPFSTELMVWEKVNENVTKTYTKEYSVGDTKIVYILDNLIVPETTHCMKVRILIKNSSWDTVTLAWDAVEGESSYQVEADGTKSQFFIANMFTKRGLLPDTEHTFRVRVVRGSTVSEWSDVVKGRTHEESFETCRWRDCPEYVHCEKGYSVDEGNPRIATKICDSGYYYWCTIIGNTPLPLNKVTSWSIKVLESKDNDGNGIYIGVAPSNIDQNTCNYDKCGWYFRCYTSTLYSGPPHDYNDKSMDKGKEVDNTSTQEALLVL